jgi:23S rRNA pseudouridine955/2504/2580 synthase
VKQGLKRMFLHAWRLQLSHPASGESVALHAALPDELQRFLPVKPVSASP